MIKLSTLFVIAMSLVACGPTMSLPQLVMKMGKEPAPGTSAVSTVGDSLYTEFDYASQSGAELVNGFSERFALGSVRIPEGFFLQARESEGGTQYCSPDKRYFDPMVGAYDIACFQDQDGDGQFERVRVPSITLGTWKMTHVGPYKKTDVAQRGSKQELVYQGLLNNVIKLAYREYQNDLIRPFFQQEVHYTLESKGTTRIAFKGATIEVEKASNSEIRYKVLTPFKVPKT